MGYVEHLYDYPLNLLLLQDLFTLTTVCYLFVNLFILFLFSVNVLTSSTQKTESYIQYNLLHDLIKFVFLMFIVLNSFFIIYLL